MSGSVGWWHLVHFFVWGMILSYIMGVGILAAVSVFPESARKTGRKRGGKSGGKPPLPRSPRKPDDRAETYRKAA